MVRHGEGLPLLQGGEGATRPSYGYESEVGQDRRPGRSMRIVFAIAIAVASLVLVLTSTTGQRSNRDFSFREEIPPDDRVSIGELVVVPTEVQAPPGYPRGADHGNPSRDVHGFDLNVGHQVRIYSSGGNAVPSKLPGDLPGDDGGVANPSVQARGDGSPLREGGDREPREQGTAQKPNIFFFLVDDMGWGDIGYQSTDFKELTPNFDALASQGIKLSNYYSMHICTPARASLMTGRYPIRYGMQYFIILPGAPWSLPRNEKLLPEYLDDAGYESHMIGKWHIGSYRYDALPQNRGFDTFLGYLHGEEDYWTHESAEAELDDRYFFDFGYGNQTSYYDVATSPNQAPDSGVVEELWDASVAGVKGYPLPRLRGGEPKMDESFVTSMIDGDWEAVTAATAAEADQEVVVDEAAQAYTGVYSEEVFAARLKRIIDEKTPWDEKPLFLYMAHQSVHSPLGQPPEGSFTAEEMEVLERLNSTSSQRIRLATTLFYLDKKFGETIAELEAHGWMENSVIVVASDNGACFVDGGTNYPWRGGKQSVFEGGTKVPAFVYSKSHIPEELWGTTHDGVVHVTDWVPTFATLAGSEISGSVGPLDGIDQWAALTDVTKQTAARDEMLYNWDQYIMSSSHGLKRCNERTQGAFRKGKWKFMTNGWCSTYNSYDPVVQGSDPLLDVDELCGTKGGCEDCNDQCQRSTDYKFGDWLFNLEEDPRETTNLILEYPEIAEELRQRATEVVYSECMDSLVKTVNDDSYDIWARHGWWMMPWYEELMGTGSE